MNEGLRDRLLKNMSKGVIALSLLFVSYHEGRRLVPYRDPVGVLTVCEGVTGPDVIEGRLYTPEECDKLTMKHIVLAQEALHRVIKVPLSMWTEVALIDWTYNFGETKLRSSTLAEKFNSHDYVGGCAELVKWRNGKVGGKLVALPGLVTRRANETEICDGVL